MNYVKVVNLINEHNDADYKGLNLNMFVPSKAIYTSDFKTAYIITLEEIIPNHKELEIITEEEYNNVKNQLEEGKEQKPQPIDPIDELRKENEALKRSQAEQDEIIMNLVLGGM